MTNGTTVRYYKAEYLLILLFSAVLIAIGAAFYNDSAVRSWLFIILGALASAFCVYRMTYRAVFCENGVTVARLGIYHRTIGWEDIRSVKVKRSLFHGVSLSTLHPDSRPVVIRIDTARGLPVRIASDMAGFYEASDIIRKHRIKNGR